MVSRAINDKFDSFELKELHIFLVQRTGKIMTPLSYHSLNLSLITLEVMRLLVLFFLEQLRSVKFPDYSNHNFVNDGY